MKYLYKFTINVWLIFLSRYKWKIEKNTLAHKILGMHIDNTSLCNFKYI